MSIWPFNLISLKIKWRRKNNTVLHEFSCLYLLRILIGLVFSIYLFVRFPFQETFIIAMNWVYHFRSCHTHVPFCAAHIFFFIYFRCRFFSLLLVRCYDTHNGICRGVSFSQVCVSHVCTVHTIMHTTLYILYAYMFIWQLIVHIKNPIRRTSHTYRTRITQVYYCMMVYSCNAMQNNTGNAFKLEHSTNNRFARTVQAKELTSSWHLPVSFLEICMHLFDVCNSFVSCFCLFVCMQHAIVGDT